MKQGKSRFSYDGLERILHEKARLSIMVSLFIKEEGHSFNELKELCGLTDGNLSRHIQVLKQAGMINVKKEFENNKPNTTCILTKKGREKFISYMNELERIIKDTKGSVIKEVNEKFSLA